MEIFGIGPLEILLILFIALIIFGPEDIVKTGKSIGRFLRNIVTSEGWRVFQRTSRDMRNLPNRLIREAGLEEAQQTLQTISPANPESQIGKDFKGIQQGLDQLQTGLSAWTQQSPSNPGNPPPLPESQPDPAASSNPFSTSSEQN
jgi:Sec-independent protein translocase protein TatA